MTTNSQKLSDLRTQIRAAGLAGYIIPHTDEYLSEYLPPSAERLAWVTGFTGSSGHAVVMLDQAVVMTDGRYTIQIHKQVDKALYQIEDMMLVHIGDWIKAHAKTGEAIGYDSRLHTKKQIEDILAKLDGTGIKLAPVNENLLDKIWTDRPSEPQGQVEMFPDEVAGQSSDEKRRIIAERCRADKIASVVITASDSICWLLNVRGADIPYNPLVLSNLILYAADGSVDWFVDPQKIGDDVRGAFGTDIRFFAPDQFTAQLSKLDGVVQCDPQRSPLSVFQILQAAGRTIEDGKDPCILPKACKTEAEQLAIRRAHIRDGVAFIRFLFWLETQDFRDGQITEITIEEKLEEFRRADVTYRGPSFHTISGWADHGAIIHYAATSETNATITNNSFLLLDSGAQYEYGTTDITRTLVIGNVSAEMKDRYTRVLKGHIALARARFSAGTDGATLDLLARQYLKEAGLDFAHGTGHGVGCFLCVHEEAASISPRGKEPVSAGMLISNEPGFYAEGSYGIRHENLILCQEDPATGELYFDTVTLVPFDLRGIDWGMITDTEYAWLKAYHDHIFEILRPFLDELELRFLESMLLK